ncbi:MAG: hypothetical protein M2R45_03094 [Verrucomicrobia subdivision 3 bacterium]|nr:hypothetical protein [Limisphaerales bacterium]MCS1413162.1 hypothetical protein [Limisphaerales bacterium]
MNRNIIFVTLALWAVPALVPLAQPDPFADRVIAYEPGTDFAVASGSGLGYTNTVSALGAPSSVTPGDFGGPVTPFAPPFLREQLLSIGNGGHLVLEFDPPIFNHPNNPFGLDFILYGNAGFSITNGNFSGGGITDGATFGHSTGHTRVSVSADNESYFTLDQTVAPIVDAFFPSDAAGTFGIPADPSLTPADFAGADLTRIRELYQTSAGGAGYDLAWARDDSGMRVALDFVHYVRIDVESDKAEIDAASAVLPAADLATTRFVETFDFEPAANGWTTTGEISLYQWLPAAGRLAVQWDSSKPNSYFHRPLGVTVETNQDFSLGFDLVLDSIEFGTTPDKPFTFPIALGLINLAQATRDGYFRGTGIHPVHGPKGVVEWNYFPDSGFGATVSSGLISQDNQWAFQNTFPLELETQTRYRIEMDYNAATQTLTTTMSANGEPFSPLNDVSLSEIFGNPLEGGFTTLNIDTLAISNYSDEGQTPPEFAGSVKAAGHVDNITVEVSAAQPASLIGPIHLIGPIEGELRLTFPALADWDYWLEQTGDFTNWITVGHHRAQETGPASFSTSLDSAPKGFFRIRGLVQ